MAAASFGGQWQGSRGQSPSPLQVEFVVDKVTLRQLSVRALLCPCQDDCSTLIVVSSTVCTLTSDSIVKQGTALSDRVAGQPA